MRHSSTRATTRRQPGIRPMRLMLDDLQWLHRPLVYYFLTQVLWGGLMTPMMFAAKGFGKDECDGLTYYIKEPEEEKEKKAQPSKASSPSLGAQLAKQLRLGEEADDTSTTTATAKSGSASSSGGGNLAAILASSTLTAMAEEAKGVVVSAATEAKGAVATLAEEAKAVMPIAEPTRQATVFIHGVGVGAGPYINLIDEIANRKEGGGYDSSSSIACPATAAANANAANEGSSGGIGGGPAVDVSQAAAEFKQLMGRQPEVVLSSRLRSAILPAARSAASSVRAALCPAV